jgi:hypothetical protein
MPINMVSHAHGQGFADSHFIIPEALGGADFRKGPYYADASGQIPDRAVKEGIIGF